MVLCFRFSLLCMQITLICEKMYGSMQVFTGAANLPHDNGRVCASDRAPVAGDNLPPPGQIPSTAPRTKEFGSRKPAPSQCVPQITGTELRAWRLCCRGLIFFFVKAQFSAVGHSPAPQKRVAGLSEWLGEKVISVTSGAGTSSQDFLDPTCPRF